MNYSLSILIRRQIKVDAISWPGRVIDEVEEMFKKYFKPLILFQIKKKLI